MSQEQKERYIYINDEDYLIVREIGYNFFIVKNKQGKFFLADLYDLACPNGGYSITTGIIIPLLEHLVEEDFEKAIAEAGSIAKRVKIIYN